MADRPGMMVGENEHPIQGAMLEVGQTAPDFTLVANNFTTRRLADYEDKVKILSVFPSINTGICSAQTRRFNEEASKLGDTIVVLSVSADLPYALRSFCGNEGIENTETLSTHRDMKFAEDYGVHDTDWRLCQRSVFVLDQNNVVQHAEYMAVMGHEVNFEASIEKAKSLV
jgi:thiol peroxidase